VHVRPFIERCPHSVSGASGATAEIAAAGVVAGTGDLSGAGRAGLVLPAAPAALSRYRASRIARIAASLLIVGSPEEL
jgi:hypothetical protein